MRSGSNGRRAGPQPAHEALPTSCAAGRNTHALSIAAPACCSRGLNYALVGRTQEPTSSLSALQQEGWVVDHVRVQARAFGRAASGVGSAVRAHGAPPAQVGRGKDAFRRAKSCVEGWGHFQLGWARVDPRTHASRGTPVAVTSRTLIMWSCNPLKVV